MPLVTIPSAMDLRRSSLTLHPNLFQLFQPMGGVKATPLSSALSSRAVRKTARSASSRAEHFEVSVGTTSFLPTEKSGFDNTRKLSGGGGSGERPPQRAVRKNQRQCRRRICSTKRRP